jgi:hypothetical protein
MNITVFTSNQPRHVALIEALAAVGDHVWAVQECTTVFPGRVADFYARSEVMQRYFARVHAAERAVFGPVRGPRHQANVTQMAIKMGDLGFLSPADLGPAMDADVFVVFGSSYIRGPLCDRLVERRAVNIHMGVSPQYRGSSCNFWAMYDGNPDLVGATLHLLTAGLDSGPMIRHALPPADVTDGFVLGMEAVRSAHAALVQLIASGQLASCDVVPQDRGAQVRYTRNADFTDAVAAEYLARPADPAAMATAMGRRAARPFLRPFVA